MRDWMERMGLAVRKMITVVGAIYVVFSFRMVKGALMWVKSASPGNL